MTEVMTSADKRLMVIEGGPRPDGISGQMLQCFLRALTDGADTPSLSFCHYRAYDCGFAPCTDCRVCRTREGCVYHDMDDFFADFASSDGIIIASPIYHMSYPAPLKTIMDRMQRYYNARFYLQKRPPIARHRPAVLLLSAGSPDETGEMAVKQWERLFTVTHCTLLTHCIARGTDQMTDETLPQKLVRELQLESGFFMKNV